VYILNVLESMGPEIVQITVGCTLCNDHRVTIIDQENPNSIQDDVKKTIGSQSIEENACINQSLCIICMENIKSTVLLPCKHLCVCEECSLNPQLVACPICRDKIIDKLKVYM